MVLLLIWLIGTAITANLFAHVTPADDRRPAALTLVILAFVTWPFIFVLWLVYVALVSLIAIGDFLFLPRWRTARLGVVVLWLVMIAALLWRRTHREAEAPVPASEVEAPAPPSSTELVVDRFEGIEYAVAPRLPTLGEWKTPVKHKPNRVFNIAAASDALEAVVIQPGAEFSFNRTVGPRTVKKGFVEAPGLFENEVQLTMGGGTCQVSSTLYAAALHAGMGIVERRPHTRPSSYIEPGLDAAVNYPEVCLTKEDPRVCYDLKLKNPFAFPIVLKAQLSDEPDAQGVWTLTVQLQGLGPVPKGTSTWTATGAPTWETKERIVRWRHDDVRKLKQHGAPGLNGFRKLVLTMPDGTVNETIIRSEYRPVPEVWEVGSEYTGPRGP